MSTIHIKTDTLQSCTKTYFNVTRETDKIVVEVDKDEYISQVIFYRDGRTLFPFNHNLTFFEANYYFNDSLRFCTKRDNVIRFKLNPSDLANCGIMSFSGIIDPAHDWEASKIQRYIVAKISSALGKFRIIASGTVAQRRWFDQFCLEYNFKLMPIYKSFNLNSCNDICTFDMIIENLINDVTPRDRDIIRSIWNSNSRMMRFGITENVNGFVDFNKAIVRNKEITKDEQIQEKENVEKI